MQNTNFSYSQEELHCLHEMLYDILAEFVRVCDKLSIDYFLIGGSAIGAYYWQGIIPFDDDIDVGMTRENYEKFLHQAPSLLNKGFFLQWMGTEPHTPYYFAKLRRDNSEYIDSLSQLINIHQGIFIDIIPFDKIPKHAWLRFWQRKIVNIANDFFISKEVWRYRYWGKCETEQYLPSGRLNSLVNRIAKVILPKSWIYKILKVGQTAFNNSSTASYYNVLPSYHDWLPVSDADNLQIVTFGPMKVKVMDHLSDYLHRHYPVLKKHLSPEEIASYSHRPVVLTFDTRA